MLLGTQNKHLEQFYEATMLPIWERFVLNVNFIFTLF